MSMTERQAMECLSLHIDEKTKDYLVSWNAATIVVAFLRDHPDVARALGINPRLFTNRKYQAQREAAIKELRLYLFMLDQGALTMTTDWLRSDFLSILRALGVTE